MTEDSYRQEGLRQDESQRSYIVSSTSERVYTSAKKIVFGMWSHRMGRVSPTNAQGGLSAKLSGIDVISW